MNASIYEMMLLMIEGLMVVLVVLVVLMLSLLPLLSVTLAWLGGETKPNAVWVNMKLFLPHTNTNDYNAVRLWYLLYNRLKVL